MGVYPTIALADARQAREEARWLLATGLDPSQAKKERKALEGDNGDTFRVIAEEYVSKVKHESRAATTSKTFEWLLDFAYPTLGDRSIRAIDAPAVLRVLREGEARGRYESARRLRSTIGSVFRYAIATA